TDEINKRGKTFKPPFKVTRQNDSKYHKSRGVQLERIVKDDPESALMSGLALRENRVAVPQKNAPRLSSDLFPDRDAGQESTLWLTMVKGIGSHDNYERVEYQEFNRGEIEALRGILDDIAREVGERVQKTDMTSGGKPLARPVNLGDLSDKQLADLERAARI